MFKIRYLTLVATVLATMVSAAMAADDKGAAAEKERKLIEVISSDAPAKDKAIPCKQLAICGTKNAVPALAALLPDKELNSWARTALEVIPDPAADDALRAALGKVQGRLLIGVINSIAVRRDAKAVDSLFQYVKAPDAEVASAAAVALGRIGGDAATRILQQSLAASPAPVRSAIGQGCVLCAEKYLADGKPAEAVKLYDLVRKSDLPKQRILEATRGAILARQSDGLPLLVEQLRSDDKDMVNIGLSTARELGGPDVAKALVAELDNIPAQASEGNSRQVRLIQTLGDVGQPAGLPAILKAAKSGSAPARAAAIRALRCFADDSCVPVLLDAALDANAELAEIAVDVLGDLPGKGADEQVVAAMQKAKGKDRVVLIQIVGQRRIESAVPALREAAKDSDEQLRCAALAAVGSAGGLGDLSVLIGEVVAPKSPESGRVAEGALRAAAIRMPDREACAELLLTPMSPAPMPVKLRLMEVVSAVGGAKALAAVGAAARSSDAQMQDAATRLLGDWTTPDAAAVLLELAKADGKYKTRALRGYLRIARQMDVPTPERLAMCSEGWKLCQQDAERKLVIQALRKAPCGEALARVLPHLSNAAFKADAAAAAVGICEKLIQRDPAAVADAMKRVLAAGATGKVADKAKTLLEQAEKAGKK
jgi:HEAT repeat protein